eukprot:CAMPEP_0177764282 /NCGR_PEP_ID=MMETSP0491_2-20121128/7318_1 /TAXON_ID=63592 /ORGANISM="Tetraselmis chuii, Strain PLY429" /LENGTH=286 /DNA_ID=CAMNT_0019280439 /DNA_START=106 /DNA_END=966 /DNA_ORIENTATION=+
MASSPGKAASSLAAIKKRVAGAIQIGAPLYNSGNVAGCETVYRETYASLLASPDVMQLTRVSKVLTAQMDKLEEGEVNKNAWALRDGFDAILELPESEPTVYTVRDAGAHPPSETLAMVTIESELQAGAFRTMNDGVMGGVSDGHVRFSDKDGGGMLFSGIVRTENNGGFASCRLQAEFPDLSSFTGLYVDCRCNDGDKVFQMVTKDEEALMTRVNFKAPFRAPASTAVARVLIPFSAFDRPERMGRGVARGPLDAATVREVGFMVLKPSVGAFELQVRELGVYKL